MRSLLLIILFNSFLFFNIPCFAEPAQQLQGLSKYDVLKLLGAPKNKIQHEVAKKEIWRYSSFQVVFISGKVVVDRDIEEKVVKESVEHISDISKQVRFNQDRNDIFKELEHLSNDNSVSTDRKNKFSRIQRKK